MSRRLAGVLATLLALASVPGAADADEGVRMTVTSTGLTAFPDVDLTVSVSGPDGRPFVLAPSELEVWLGDERVAASVTSAVEVRPVDVVLLLDRSGSMSGQPMADAIAATATFLDLLGPRDRSALIGFSTRAELLQPLTADRAAARATASSITADGNTALYDAVALAARHLAEAGRPDARHAVVVLTDGNDTASSVRREDVLSSLREDTVHAVALGPAPDVNALGALAAASSGGVVLRAPTSAQLGAAYVAMAERLRADNGIRFRIPVRRFAPEIAVRVVARRDGVIVGEIDHRFALPVAIPDTAAAPIVPTVVEPEPAVVAPATPPSDGAPTALAAGMLGGATVLALMAWALSTFGPVGA
ncbi:MAG: VWA domain-containing protein, partial [Chloroflexi bacterium]|nr:VWA domain-containing protein [Chloroflexota bacterium]